MRQFRLMEEFVVPERALSLFGQPGSSEEPCWIAHEQRYPKGLVVEVVRRGFARDVAGIVDGTKICVCVHYEEVMTPEGVGSAILVAVPEDIVEEV